MTTTTASVTERLTQVREGLLGIARDYGDQPARDGHMADAGGECA